MSESGSGVQAAVTQPDSAATVTLKSPFQRKTDVFDSEDFDPVKFVNQIYPDGELHITSWESSGPQPARHVCNSATNTGCHHIMVWCIRARYMLHLQSNLVCSETGI
jgi:hypothetical protein